MKHSIFTLLAFLLSIPVLTGQTPLYLQFDPSCVNQLEYQFTYTGRNLQMYSVPKGENELYFFVIGNKEPAATSKLPAGAVTCGSDDINATLVDNINAGGRLAYIVFKTQSGYLSYPVESAGYIARSGTLFAFRSPNYDFVMDTSSINYARNLSRPGVASPVYLTGRRSHECLQLYAFRLEPAQPESPRADVEVIPGIGIISDRTGLNGSEMEQNIYRLLRINGIVLDDYVHTFCHAPKNKEDDSATFITSLPPGVNNPNDAFKVENPFAEPDKEGYYTQPPKAGNTVELANCPTPPGYGYHIVQPGDSLNSIARTYNVDTKTLMQWNKLQNTSQINVCDKIWVTRPPASEATAVAPAPASGYHVVQKGETLYGIARKYNLTEATIREYNKFPASGKVNIIPGQKIAVTKSQAPEKTAVNNSAKSTTPVENRPAAAPPAAPAAAGLPAGRLSYKVKKGETLSMIAWNVGYTAPYLRHINKNINTLPATDNEPLPEGLLLVVSDSKGDREDLSTFVPPVAAPGTYPSSQNVAVTAPPVSYEYIGEYIVQPDDTLASIAQQYGLAPEKLAAANNLKPGQQPAPRSILKIPK